MNYSLYFWGTAVVLTVVVIWLDQWKGMLRDESSAILKPFSLAKLQLIWWLVIIISSFVAIIFATGKLPIMNESTLILLGIGATTTLTGLAIDKSDISKSLVRHQNQPRTSFFMDILTDENGVSIGRFQTLIFHFVFGIWFVHEVLMNLNHPGTAEILPDIGTKNLILLGFSSGTYAFLKTSENGPAPKTPAA